MLEIEQKYRVGDPAPLLARMAALGLHLGAVQVEADHYLNAPDRDFARTDEAFRLRRIAAQNYLTYKGPKKAGPVKTREELEIAVPDGDEAAAQYLKLFACLGYRFVTVVTKQRRSASWQRDGFDLTLCLDEVAGLGCFAEVEVLAEPERVEAARAVVQAVAGDLGLTTVEPRSYLGMVLETVGR
jgi:adenylate cyclase class 2